MLYPKVALCSKYAKGIKFIMRKFLLLLIATCLTGCNLGAPAESELPTREGQEIATEEIQPTETPTRQVFVTRTPLPTAGGPAPVNPTPLPAPQNNLPPTVNVPQSGGGSSGSSGTGTSGNPPSFSPVDVSQQQVFGLRYGGDITGGGLNVLNTRLDYFAQNPANPNQYVVIDQLGLLFVTGAGGAGAARVESGPFTQFLPADRASNNVIASSAVWSPNGQFVAFIINGDQTAADGVWVFQPGVTSPLQLLVDCPTAGFVGCNIVVAPDSFAQWESLELEFSPASDALLVRVNLPGRGQSGLIVVPLTTNERARDNRPPVLLYEYGSWGGDGRILTSGRNPNGVQAVAWIDRSGNVLQPVDTAGVALLWAVARPDGQIVGLAGSGGALSIYDTSGRALTGPIGDGFPERVVWSPDRSAVMVARGGKLYLASVAGWVTEITAQAGGLPVNWVK